jgi:hypothetical protein
MEPMDEERFWALVAALGWPAGPDPVERAAQALRAATTRDERAAFASWRMEILSEMTRRVERWESATGEQIPCGDDRLRDLLNHVIGLGREEAAAALADPSRLMERARAGEFLESFAYVE